MTSPRTESSPQVIRRKFWYQLCLCMIYFSKNGGRSSGGAKNYTSTSAHWPGQGIGVRLPARCNSSPGMDIYTSPVWALLLARPGRVGEDGVHTAQPCRTQRFCSELPFSPIHLSGLVETIAQQVFKHYRCYNNLWGHNKTAF
jgi:hypothetical protein